MESCRSADFPNLCHIELPPQYVNSLAMYLRDTLQAASRAVLFCYLVLFCHCQPFLHYLAKCTRAERLRWWRHNRYDVRGAHPNVHSCARANLASQV